MDLQMQGAAIEDDEKEVTVLSVPWTPKIEKLKEQLEALIAVDASGLKVVEVNGNNFELAKMLSMQLTCLRNDIVLHHDPMIKAAHQAHVAANTAKKTDLEPVTELEAKIDSAILKYNAQQKRIQEQAQREADALAAEQQRKEQEKLLAKAAKAEADGKIEKAEDLAEQAAAHFVPSVQLPPEVQKTNRTEAGTMSLGMETYAAATNTLEIVKAIAQGREVAGHKLPITCIEIKEGVLKRWAVQNEIKNFQGNGIRVWQEGKMIKTAKKQG